MATTSPDNLKTPDAGDQYALVQDLGALADTVQIALVKRANSYVGTSAQRTAFVSAPAGALWGDTDGGQQVWRKTSSGWELTNVGLDSGWVPIPLRAGFTGTLRWRRLGPLVEVDWSGAGSFPVGATSISSGVIPATVRPSGNKRGSAALNANAAASLYVTGGGEVGVINSTGASRGGGEGTCQFMLG